MRTLWLFILTVWLAGCVPFAVVRSADERAPNSGPCPAGSHVTYPFLGFLGFGAPYAALAWTPVCQK